MTNLASLRELIERWEAERAHTYSSENADHYRGFDAGRKRCAEELGRWLSSAEKREPRAERVEKALRE